MLRISLERDAGRQGRPAYRQIADSQRVETRVRLIKNGELSKEKSYQVYLRPGRQSLVLFQSREVSTTPISCPCPCRS